MNQDKAKISSADQAIMARTHSEEFSVLESVEFHPDTLWNRVNGDSELLCDLVEIFAGQCPKLIAQLEEAIAQGSPAGVKKVSHMIKGSALQLSATGVAELASALEEMGERETLAGSRQTLERLKAATQSLMEKLKLMSSVARTH
jgi:HPt (histidine-containing phosphotransfer) domain-containing protein